MTLLKTKIGRRSFLKTSTAVGGGLMISFSWLASCISDPKKVMEMPKEWFELNGYLKVGDNGLVTIISPNPEIGQNVKTSMPMIVADELDADWEKVLVEQGPLNTDIFTRQLAGGSQSIRQGWEGLRMAGATARQMLKEAAAQAWKVPIGEIKTQAGTLSHSSGKKASYGEMASAASKLKTPEEIKLKDISEFTIIGTPQKNVDGLNIVTGKPLFGLDYQKEGMLIAMVVHPPAFGMKLKSVDAEAAKAMPGIKDVFTFDTFKDDYAQIWSDVAAFTHLVAVVGTSTWEVMNARKALKLEWEPFETHTKTVQGFGGGSQEVEVPGGLESSKKHREIIAEYAAKPGNVVRKDGDPEAAFKNAAKVVESQYFTPFHAHNCMEPLNFFADVTKDQAVVAGPIQTPEYLEKTLEARLGLPLDKIDIQMTRMGGGFGRKLYGHFGVEAAIISQKMNAPVKLIYTREDDMTDGNYSPAFHASFRAALDENNNLIAFHVKAGGIPQSPLFANRFPAGAVENYLAESWEHNSNISVAAFRAPRSNFMAGAEQSFLDEVAEAAGKDPIKFRLELFERAINNPVGEDNDYDAKRYAGVLELVRDKSNWAQGQNGMSRGVAAYYCHNSYVAQVVDLEMKNGKPVIQKVHCAVDCGIVVNPLAATNLVEGGTVDGIGHAMYNSGMTFSEGKPDHSNFNTYQWIRNPQAPKDIDVHFVQNDIDPTGLGEPPFPPVMGALANALYKATNKRYYDQPYMGV